VVTVLEGAGLRQNIGKLLTVKPLHTGREVHSRSTLVGLVTGTVCSSSKNREVSLVVPHEVDGSIAARNDWRTKLILERSDDRNNVRDSSYRPAHSPPRK